MIRLFYYEPETDQAPIRDNLKNLVDGTFTQNDLLIVDHQTYVNHFWPTNNGIDNKHLITDSDAINYEKIANQKLNNIFVYDFRYSSIVENHLIENLIKIKSINCDIFGISFRSKEILHTTIVGTHSKTHENVPTLIRNIEDAVILVKDLKLKKVNDEEIIILLKLKENYSNDTINTIMNYYVCKNDNIDLATVASFNEIIKHKRI